MSETSAPEQPDEATMDLLVKRAIEGLSPAEQRALDVEDRAAVSAYLADFERAAAAAALAASAGAEAPPPALVARLERQGRELLAPNLLQLKAVPGATAAAPPAKSPGPAYGWFAAAACLLLAVFGWLRSPPPQAPAELAEAGRPPVTAIAPPAAPKAPTLQEARAALLARAGSLKLTWGATKDALAAGVAGDVVWDPETQQGFMRFVNLPTNDPHQHQYQLWIFDAARDKRYPVDGGVFDVPAGSTEVLVPIHAALPVSAARAFAVTVEKPGGVVVSAREHILVLAQAS